jgi:hypothetical protein
MINQTLVNWTMDITLVVMNVALIVCSVFLILILIFILEEWRRKK